MKSFLSEKVFIEEDTATRCLVLNSYVGIIVVIRSWNLTHYPIFLPLCDNETSMFSHRTRQTSRENLIVMVQVLHSGVPPSTENHCLSACLSLVSDTDKRVTTSWHFTNLYLNCHRSFGNFAKILRQQTHTEFPEISLKGMHNTYVIMCKDDLWSFRSYEL